MNHIEFTFCELREKTVVNVTDGKKLGRLSDIALNCRGQTIGIIVPGEVKFLKSITGSNSIFIPWQCILKIGDDVILVDLNNNPTPRCDFPSPCS